MVDRWQGGGDYGRNYGGDYYEPHRPPVNPRYTRVLPEPGGPMGQPGGPPPRRPGGPPPGGPGGRPRMSTRRRRWRLVRRIIALLVVLFVVGAVITWFYVDSSLQRTAALSDYGGRPAQGAGTNWLIVGSDSRQGLTDAEAAQLHTGDSSAVSGGRTDTIMVVHLPDNGTKPTMVSLLRDSRVSIPGHGHNKINAAFAFGGAPLLVKTVEGATGLRIDHYAEIGLGGFASVVDDVGGVRMCLSEPVKDKFAGINLPAGCQNLNGANALGYVRSRHAFAASDFARTEHQRQFIGALAGKLASPGVFLNPFKFFPVMSSLPKALTVDNGDHLQNLLGLAWAMRGISGGGVVTTAVPIGGSSGGDLLWDRAKATDLFDDLNTDKAVPAGLITTH